MPLTNSLDLPQPFVDAATSDHKYTPKRYSVTEVLGGTCEAVLKRRHAGEGEEDVADSVWRIFGSAVHKVLEQAEASPTQLQEQWFSVEVQDGYTLSGIFDLYDEATKTVVDWKTTGTIKWQKQEFEDYRLQTLIYCWMLRHEGYDAENGEVIMLLRDWSKPKARFEKGYPQHQVQKVSWKFSERDFDEAGRYVADWFSDVILQEKRPDEELEPCSPKNRWHKDDKWAVVKNGVKRATRVLDDQEKANALCDELSRKTGKPHHVEYRKGEDVKCEMYCSVAFACPFHLNSV